MKPIRIFLYKKKHRSGNLTWVVRWKHPVTGQWFNLSGGKTKAEAEAVKAKLWQDLYNGKDPIRETPQYQKLTIEELAKLFFQSPRYLTFSEHWQKVFRGQIEKVIVPALGKQIVVTLRRDAVLKLYLALKEKGLSHSTIRKYHLALSVLGKYFEEINAGEQSPLRQLGNFSKLFPRQSPTRTISFLTPEELERIFAVLKERRSLHPLAIIKFLASTGLRRSEVLALTWSDIEFSDGFILVRKSKTGRARRVPLERGALEALSLMPRSSCCVFVNSRGAPYHQDSIIKPLKDAAKKAGISKRVDVHMLRHSYGSNKIRAGWGLKKVSTILGHADISITAEVYTHLLDGDLKVRDEALVTGENARERVMGGSAFDIDPLSDNSGELRRHLSVIQAVESITEQLLQLRSEDLGSDQLQHKVRTVIESATSRVALGLENCMQMQEAAAKSPDSAPSMKTGGHVPHMFRKRSESESTEKKKRQTVSDSLVVPVTCLTLDMADPRGLEPLTFRSVV